MYLDRRMPGSPCIFDEILAKTQYWTQMKALFLNDDDSTTMKLLLSIQIKQVLVNIISPMATVLVTTVEMGGVLLLLCIC